MVGGSNKQSKNCLLECFESWMTNPSIMIHITHKALPCYKLWGLWLCRNKMIFQGSIMAFGLVSYKIRLSYREGWKAPKLKLGRILTEQIINVMKSWGLFDSTCQSTPCLCGARAFIFLNNHCYFTFKYYAGVYTNNKE